MDEHCRIVHDSMLDSMRNVLGDPDDNDSPVGVAFSGGVDSTLLAVMCSTMGYDDVRLLTVGFEQSRDVMFAHKVAPLLPGAMMHHTLEFEARAGNFENTYDVVRDMIHTSSLSWIENAIAFYRISILARDVGVERVVAANGIDELFCGYDAYRRALSYTDDSHATAQGSAADMSQGAAEPDALQNDNINTHDSHDENTEVSYNIISELMQKKLENELRMFDAIGRMAHEMFGVRLLQPLLEESFIKAAYMIPVFEKIKGPDDMMRKHVIRRLACDVGVPRVSYEKKKKALQYGSGIHKAVMRIRKERDLQSC